MFDGPGFTAAPRLASGNESLEPLICDLSRIVYALAKPFSSAPEQGADSLIWLATSPDAASLKGEYVSKRRPVTPQKQALDPKLAADLWTLSERLCAEAASRTA
jgi:hypothetical protein